MGMLWGDYEPERLRRLMAGEERIPEIKEVVLTELRGLGGSAKREEIVDAVALRTGIEKLEVSKNVSNVLRPLARKGLVKNTSPGFWALAVPVKLSSKKGVK